MSALANRRTLPGLALWGGLFLSASVCSLSALSADIYYVFTDKHGRTVMQDTIPPEYVGQGYRIVNKNGVTLQVIPPLRRSTLDPEHERIKQQRLDADRALIQTYASVAEIEAVREKRVASIEDIIRTTEAHNASFQRNLETLRDRAQAHIAKGEAVPDALSRDIDELSNRIAANDEYVQRKRDEQQGVREKFARDISRFKELQEKSRQ